MNPATHEVAQKVQQQSSSGSGISEADLTAFPLSPWGERPADASGPFRSTLIDQGVHSIST